MSAGAGVKLVFIDIDGVMNNTADGTSYLSYDPKRYGLSKRNVFALRRILKRTGAKLVLSTSWRNHPPDYCHQYRIWLLYTKFSQHMFSAPLSSHSFVPVRPVSRSVSKKVY